MSPGAQGHRYLTILEQARSRVAADGHREPSSSWQPDYLSEPWGLFPVDHDEPVDVRDRDGRPLSRAIRDYRVNALDHLRSEGPVRTTRKAASVLKRRSLQVLRRGRI